MVQIWFRCGRAESSAGRIRRGRIKLAATTPTAYFEDCVFCWPFQDLRFTLRTFLLHPEPDAPDAMRKWLHGTGTKEKRATGVEAIAAADACLRDTYVAFGQGSLEQVRRTIVCVCVCP